MSKLPTKKDLVNDVALYEQQDELSFLLNQEPPEKWVKTHPYIRSHRYVPIDKVEYLLRSIFKNNYKIEITNQGTSFNGVWVTTRLHYKDLITNEWKYHDGIGACELQTKKGSSPANLNDINNGALSMAFPIAKTLSLKDAADNLGRIFGSDLNRKDIIPVKTPESLLENSLEALQELFKNIDQTKMPPDDIINIERIIDQKETTSYRKAIVLIKKHSK